MTLTSISLVAILTICLSSKWIPPQKFNLDSFQQLLG